MQGINVNDDTKKDRHKIKSTQVMVVVCVHSIKSRAVLLLGLLFNMGELYKTSSYTSGNIQKCRQLYHEKRNFELSGLSVTKCVLVHTAEQVCEL